MNQSSKLWVHFKPAFDFKACGGGNPSFGYWKPWLSPCVLTERFLAVSNPYALAANTCARTHMECQQMVIAGFDMLKKYLLFGKLVLSVFSSVALRLCGFLCAETSHTSRGDSELVNVLHLCSLWHGLLGFLWISLNAPVSSILPKHSFRRCVCACACVLLRHWVIRGWCSI